MTTARTPAETVHRLIEALGAGDLDTVMACYAPEATFVAEPGKPVAGKPAIRRALEEFVANLRPALTIQTSTEVIAGDTALFCARWTLVGTTPDKQPVNMSGQSADILSRQSDGRWLMVVDNPWGVTLLEP